MPKASQSDQISTALAKIRAPLFLARWSDLGGSPCLVLHTAESRSAKALRRQAGAVLKSAGIDCALKVVVHRPNKLTRFRSLEGLMKRLHGGAIVYDPTQFVGRSEAIVKLGVALRRALPEKIAGLFIEAERRNSLRARRSRQLCERRGRPCGRARQHDKHRGGNVCALASREQLALRACNSYWI